MERQFLKFKDVKTIPGYEHLEDVLVKAYLQASTGKGAERHADAKPFTEQPMQTIAKSLGSVDGMMFQVNKKLGESRGLPNGRAQAEVLGAIVYSAGVHIAYDSWFARPLDADIKTGVGAVKSDTDTGWTPNRGVAPEQLSPLLDIEVEYTSGRREVVAVGNVYWGPPTDFGETYIHRWRLLK